VAAGVGALLQVAFDHLAQEVAGLGAGFFFGRGSHIRDFPMAGQMAFREGRRDDWRAAPWMVNGLRPATDLTRQRAV
jgi:hypothetical protein